MTAGTGAPPDAGVAEMCTFEPDARHHRAVTEAYTAQRLRRLGQAARLLDRLWPGGRLPELLAPNVLLQPAVVAALSNDPLFHGALTGCVTGLRGGGVPAAARAHLMDVVAALIPLIGDRLTAPVTLRLDHRGGRGLGLTASLSAGPEYAGDDVVLWPGTAERRVEATVVTAGRRSAPVAVRARRTVSAGSEGRTLGYEPEDDQLARLLNDLSHDPDSSAAGHARLRGYTDTELAAFPAGLALLAHAWPAMFDELCAAVRLVVPIFSETKSAFTNTAWQGAIFINQDLSDVLFLLERCVHEASHLRLNAVMNHVTVHEHSWDDKVQSPFRPGPRPITGLYHGAFVFSRVARLMALLAPHPRYGADAADRVRALLGQISPSLRTIADEVRLTPQGERLFAEIVEVHGELSRSFPGPPKTVKNQRYLMEEM